MELKGQNHKVILRFQDGRYLKSFTLDENGKVDDITTTANSLKALAVTVDEAVEYKADLFKFLKPTLVDEGTHFIRIPTQDEYRMLYERKLEHSSNKEICDEIISRLDVSITVSEIRARLEFCFGCHVDIHTYGNEVNIEDVFKGLKGIKRPGCFINGFTQYRWQCNESIEIIELGKRPQSGFWIHKRYVIDFKYESALEMLTDKKFKFPTNGYFEGCVCENVFFGNTHDTVESINCKRVITPNPKLPEYKITI